MKYLVSRIHPTIFLFASGLVLFLNRSLNFDMHHDGLITTNLIELRNSFEYGGPWPFNQYGVTWLLPYLPIILTGDSNSIYERANWVSLAMYSLSLIISYFTARKFMGALPGVFVPVFLAATASLGNLRTWPSVSAMLYLSSFLLAVVSYLSNGSSLGNLKRIAFFMGAVIPLIILSRVQVGSFLLLIFSIFVFKFGLSKTRRYFSYGFISSSTLIVYFLAKNLWLKPALTDTFVYSLNYLSNDETRVVPFFTLIGAAIVFVACYAFLSDSFPIKPAQILIFTIASGLIVLLALYVKTVLGEGPDSISFYTILLRRLFVSTLIGAFLYWFVSQVRVVIEERNSLSRSQNLRMLALVLVSSASLLQLVPLFDSTHAWWASPPLVILLALLISRVIKKYLTMVRTELMVLALSLVTIFLLLFSVLSYKFEEKRLVAFDSRFASNAMSFDFEVSEQKQLSEMAFSKAPAGSKFLNLCINPNVFLTRNGYQSASRFYISWPNMRGYSEFVEATRVSQPDFILTCSDLPNPAAGILTEEDRNDLQVSQDLIIQQVFSRPILVDQFNSRRDVQWKLWSNK